MRYPIRVLFLCTGNSARSQMAEGLLRSVGSGDFEVHSAGTDPKGLHPPDPRIPSECAGCRPGRSGSCRARDRKP